MPDRPIIPTSYPVLMPYLYNTDVRQLAINPDTTNPYWTDYGWTSAHSTQWTAFKTLIIDLYADWTNPTKSTPTLKQDLDTAIANFRAFVETNSLITKIRAWSGVGNADANVFNFDLETADPTHLNSKISTVPSVDIKNSGPGAFDIHCRTATDESRASIDREHGATEVEFAYAIFDHAPTEEEVLDPDDIGVFSKGHSQKAHFPFMAGNANRRKYLVTYFRWNNASYPQFAGSWSSMQTNIIA